MGGTVDLPTLTVGSCNIGWPYEHYPWPNQSTPTVYYYNTQTPPVECAGEVHVFPCPHCEKCKCGKASVKRDTKKK